jgi:hypothetical protein
MSESSVLITPCSQICMWCWHRIREHHDGLCPNCRNAYAETPHHMLNNTNSCNAPVHLYSLDKAQEERKRARRAMKRNKPDKKMSDQNRRVIVPNVVYLVGLPEAISRDEVGQRLRFETLEDFTVPDPLTTDLSRPVWTCIQDHCAQKSGEVPRHLYCACDFL